MEDNIIYILTNEAMPSYIKIGKTGNLKKRLKQLNNTSIPLPFTIFYARRVFVNDVEKKLHIIFDDYRENPKREFFKIDPEKARECLQLVDGKEILLEENSFIEDKKDIESINKIKQKKQNFNFKMVEIPINSELIFTKNEDRKVIVKSEKNLVELEGEELTISAAAHKLLKEEGYDWTSVQGASFFEYEGETLKDRRERFENEE